ncbi:ABC transporter permease [Pseudalkalibacillus salsuginis]|uniref:ABC transporter permease n=1 Tax=Pseudalkalibacillus salsuginis TaxID=2910972 RepID=UPI001F466F3E|nr:ABC transporter permease [Pseudalkalibacillus salsuginis]MCF6411374.1 ABC transporter permease [Pseudalkalibacillus salsuginis]
MSINQIILRNLKKNLTHYYLYVFALIFSVALYFAFVTLQYDPAMDEVKGSIKGGAALRAASILLVGIVTIFLLYANNLFIKRRSKEIGLFQLIGMTKNNIFRILSIENMILYFGSLIIGIFLGFSVSKLIMMVLFKTIGIEEIANLYFSDQSFSQTLIVFTLIYGVIMLMNYMFIKRQSILSLFRVTSSTESKVKKLSVFEMIIGLIGMVAIISGYYISSKLFGGDFSTMNELFLAMTMILAFVIIGTYLFYKGSVRLISNMIRKKKDGYLNIQDVLSLSSIMFRMKSNALLLTVITTVSALAIGLLSLSYISYYSAEKTAENYVPSHFALTDLQDVKKFTEALEANEINYSEKRVDVIQVEVDIKHILATDLELNLDPNRMTLPVIADGDMETIDVSADETVFTGYNDLMQKFMTLKDSGDIELKGQNQTIPQNFSGLKKDYPVSAYFSNGGLPVVIVDETVFEKLKNDLDPDIQKESSTYIGIDIAEEDRLKEASGIFQETNMDDNDANSSRIETSNNQKMNMGLIMFIVGFLGLTFLITSGCVLYFKQMDEGESEKPDYTILRKLGFTQGDLLKGVRLKQIYNFGIPLLVGLLHSYFAVQSGWFLFGTELWTPMIIVMVLYTSLYSIFGILSVLYYKKVIEEAL